MNKITRRAAILGTIGAVAASQLPAVDRRTALVGQPIYGLPRHRAIAFMSFELLVSCFFETMQTAQCQAKAVGGQPELA